MPNIYQTDNMEAAMRRLGETNRNLLLYWNFKAVKPIRIRMNLTRDILCEDARAWKPGAQATVDRWTQRGGTLIWRPHPITAKAPVPACDAMLFTECPFQIDRFEHIIQSVRQEVVVYRPPTWQLHNETIEYFYPGKDVYVTLEAICKGLLGRELTEEMQGVLTACRYPVATTAVYTAWDVKMLTGWSEKFLKHALHYRYKYHSGRWQVYSTRIPPENDDMRWAYELLRSQPEVAFKSYAMKNGIPAGGRVPGFEVMLKRLMKENYVVREENIYVLNTAHPPMDHDKVDAVNNMFRGRFWKMKALVDSAPEYPL